MENVEETHDLKETTGKHSHFALGWFNCWDLLQYDCIVGLVLYDIALWQLLRGTKEKGRAHAHPILELATGIMFQHSVYHVRTE